MERHRALLRDRGECLSSSSGAACPDEECSVDCAAGHRYLRNELRINADLQTHTVRVLHTTMDDRRKGMQPLVLSYPSSQHVSLRS